MISLSVAPHVLWSIAKRLYHQGKKEWHHVEGLVHARFVKSHCPLCGFKNQRLEHFTLFHYYLRCSSCNLIYVGDSSSLDAIIAFYEVDAFALQRHQFHGVSASDERTWKEWLHFKEHTFQQLNVPLTPSKTEGLLLEVGCGEGFLLDFFARHGWSVSGMELNRAIAETVTARGFTVVSEPIEQFSAEPGSYERILLFHVLEHLKDPFLVLRKLNNLLALHGDLILETPLTRNYESIDHRYFFDQQNLVRALTEAGFTIEGSFIYQDKLHPEFTNIALRCVKQS